MPGPIFISHASADKDDVVALADALRLTFRGSLRLFNTSSGAAIPLGSNWRERILDALRESPLVILWATQSALASREVAFEIGAACAYEREVIPCCIHVPPSALPWSLQERQALIMDTEQGWSSLAERVAELVGFGGSLDLEPFALLANRFRAPNNAVEIQTLGYTVEVRNVGSSPVYNVALTTEDRTSTPDWLPAVEREVLAPAESVVVFRDPTLEDAEVLLEWTDIAGARRTRRLTVPATDEAAT